MSNIFIIIIIIIIRSLVWYNVSFVELTKFPNRK